MAEFAELFEEGFEGTEILGEDGAVLDTVEGAADYQAEIDALFDDVLADLDGIGDGEVADVTPEAQEAEIENAARDAGKEVEKLNKVDVTDIDPWESRKKFGKWVGTEIAKGALFVVGMKVVEAAFQQLAKPKDGKQPSKTAEEALGLAKNSTAAMKIVKKVLESWNSWLVHNYLKRKTFGSVKAEGVKVWHYQVFQSQVADLNDERNGRVTKAATKATKSKRLVDMKKLIKLEKQLVKNIQNVTTWLHENGDKLTKAGLPEQTEDVEKAMKLLSSSGSSGTDTGGDEDGDDDDENGGIDDDDADDGNDDDDEK